MALYSETKSLVSRKITKAIHFLATEKWYKKCVQFSWNILLCQTILLIKNECHIVVYYGLFPKDKSKAILRLIKVKLFQPGVSKHHTIQLYFDALFVRHL